MLKGEWNPDFLCYCVNQELNNDYSGTEIMLAQRLQAKPEPHEDPLLCSRLLQQEAAIFSQSPSTPPGCDVGYGEWEFQRQLSASCLLLCFFWSCVSKFNGTLYSHCPCRTSQPCSIEKYFDKMAASYMARIPQSRSSSCGSNSAYSRCTSMILYQINCCFTVD